MPLETRPLTATDLPALQAVMVDTPGYFDAIGAPRPEPTGTREAETVLWSAPPGRRPGEKTALGLWLDGALVGCAEMILDAPRQGIALIGLILVVEELQSCGLGTVAFGELAQRAQEGGAERLRVGIPKGYAHAEHFWARRGLRVTGEVGRDPWGYTERDVHFFERPLRRVAR